MPYNTTMPRNVIKSNKSKQKQHETNPDIHRFIDFFVRTGERILGTKPQVIRGKDGRLVSFALRKLPVGKLETLTVWFLARKKKLRPLIGTMLSVRVLDELMREMNKSSFWKDVDQLMDCYYPRQSTPILWQPFTYKDITNMKEEVARTMRKL
ncbi:MAG: hypothetical protein G01um101429_956 [Parcubacteria group bacterium Gr01-1014_29]|nr:MAG: hypothetical protein G01um101429_956 [Parcubacteria group bacterium Gr01-1014_29]